ncbi:MAG: hypothetical protein HYY01_14980, partial [Chloroflexi bacterium]|nr:hypothetical protein [Chloroflexota bacterium]
AECFKVVLSCHPEGVPAEQNGLWEYHVRSTGGLMPGTPLLRQSLRYTTSRPRGRSPLVSALVVLMVLGLVVGGAYAAITVAAPDIAEKYIGSLFSSSTATPTPLFQPTSTPRLLPTATSATVLKPLGIPTQPLPTPTPAPSLTPTAGPTAALRPTPTATARPTLAPTPRPIATAIVILPLATRTPTPIPTPIPTSTPTAAPAARVLASDSFNRPDADRCALGHADLALGGAGEHFYMPIWPTGGTDAAKPIGANIVANALQNNGLDVGGVQFASAQTCSRLEYPAEILPQDLNIRVDLLVPTDSAGHVTLAGPYFRSRKAAPGDGLIGGTSAGYWVQLHSTGEVKVKRLNPHAVVATTGQPASFDSKAFHTLEIAAQGNTLQVALDKRLLTFNQDGKLVSTVSIPPAWESPQVGFNQGAAGISFGTGDKDRGLIGGQRADNLVVTTYRPLSALLTPSNVAP